MKAQELKQSLVDHLQTLAHETDQAKRSATILEYLDCMARFHVYSPQNTLSILLHCPHATHVAGFTTWKKFGRYVRKGEKGIPILAPCPVKGKSKKEQETEKESKDTVAAKDTKASQISTVFFKIVYVFDVSQTEGNTLPEAPITPQGSDQGLLLLLETVTDQFQIRLEYKALTGSHHGTSYGGYIVVDDRLDPGGKTLVLLHELAHELLHRGPDRSSLSRQQKELEAEATAYVVARHFQLQTASAEYLALWDVPEEEIIDVFQRIHTTASTLITSLESLRTNQP